MRLAHCGLSCMAENCHDIFLRLLFLDVYGLQSIWDEHADCGRSEVQEKQTSRSVDTTVFYLHQHHRQIKKYYQDIFRSSWLI